MYVRMYRRGGGGGELIITDLAEDAGVAGITHTELVKATQAPAVDARTARALFHLCRQNENRANSITCRLYSIVFCTCIRLRTLQKFMHVFPLFRIHKK